MKNKVLVAMIFGVLLGTFTGLAYGKSHHKVVVYTSPGCHFCDLEKTYLKSKGVKYRECSITKKECENALVNIYKSEGVPLTVVDDKIIIQGFDKNKLDKALR